MDVHNQIDLDMEIMRYQEEVEGLQSKLRVANTRYDILVGEILSLKYVIGKLIPAIKPD